MGSNTALVRKMNQTQPWDRMEGETARAFQGFQAFRDMGPDRSLAQVARKLEKTLRMMERWSAQWQWVGRAESWDAHLDLIEQEKSRKEMHEARKRWAKAGSLTLDTGMMSLMKTRAELEKPNSPPLPVPEATRLITAGADVEMKARMPRQSAAPVEVRVGQQVQVTEGGIKQLLDAKVFLKRVGEIYGLYDDKEEPQAVEVESESHSDLRALLSGDDG